MINSKKVTLWPKIMKSRHLRFLQTLQDPVTCRKRANRCYNAVTRQMKSTAPAPMIEKMEIMAAR